MLQSEESITPVGAVLGTINGMVGSLVLLLPVLALQAGYLTALAAILLTGTACAFSSWVYFQHLGDEPDIGHALRQHFAYSLAAKLAYDCAAWLFIVLACIEYFQLIVAQWTVILPAAAEGWGLVGNVAGNGALLLGLVLLLKYWEYGATTMVYGIGSIAIYLIYLLGVLIARPSGPAPVPFPPLSPRVFPLTAAMSQGFMIQVFLIPFLQNIRDRQNEQRNFAKYAILSYGIGAAVYLFIAEVGAFGIAPRSYQWNPQEFGILAYLPGSWELSFVCAVYTLHLLSVFPEFLLISKRIFFENLEQWGLRESTRRAVSLQEGVYLGVWVGVSMGVALLRVPVEYLMMVNGGILGSLVIYIIPSLLHLRCMLCLPPHLRQPFPHEPPSPHRPTSEIEISSLSSRPSSECAPKASIKASLLSQVSRIEHNYVQCECGHYLMGRWAKGGVGALLVGMMVLGVSVMVFSILETFGQ